MAFLAGDTQRPVRVVRSLPSGSRATEITEKSEPESDTNQESQSVDKSAHIGIQEYDWPSSPGCGIRNIRSSYCSGCLRVASVLKAASFGRSVRNLARGAAKAVPSDSATANPCRCGLLARLGRSKWDGIRRP